MKLRQLEMKLEALQGFINPSPSLEQYQTPAPLAARLLHTAMMNGDITGKKILDLGSGTGILSIGSWLLGASEVFAIDIDREAIRIAEENAARYECEITFIEADISRPDRCILFPEVDTIIMNPPFGAQNEHADRPFIDCALSKGKTIYGIFNAGTTNFLTSYISGRGNIEGKIAAGLTIPRTFVFHKDDSREIQVEIFIIRKISL